MKLPAISASILLLVFQVILIVIYAVAVDYSKPVASTDITNFYPVFQDVNVMIFIGFGFLMTFLKKYGYSAVGYNLLISAVTIQWSMVLTSWLANAANKADSPGKVKLSVTNLITADFNAGTVLITFGAVLGKTSRLQLVVIAIVETVFYGVNEMLLVHYLKVTDIGGSMIIHMFGAYFGLAVAFALRKDELRDGENAKEASNVNSDLFSMIGTVFLWMYWPSFNGVLLGPGLMQSRAFINTYISLAACCVSAFVVSSMVDPNRKLNMVHVQNATLAGGVAVGAAANLIIHPWGAMLVGSLAGIISTLGYQYIQPFLLRSINLHDTCGVHNLHGLPAIFSGILATIASAVADESDYGADLYAIWPARLKTGDNRSKSNQAGYQFLAVVVTLAMSIVGGLITGFFVSLLDNPSEDQWFDDEDFWEVPALDFEAKGVVVNHASSHVGPMEMRITTTSVGGETGNNNRA